MFHFKFENNYSSKRRITKIRCRNLWMHSWTSQQKSNCP